MLPGSCVLQPLCLCVRCVCFHSSWRTLALSWPDLFFQQHHIAAPEHLMHGAHTRFNSAYKGRCKAGCAAVFFMLLSCVQVCM